MLPFNPDTATQAALVAKVKEMTETMTARAAASRAAYAELEASSGAQAASKLATLKSAFEALQVEHATVAKRLTELERLERGREIERSSIPQGGPDHHQLPHPIDLLTEREDLLPNVPVLLREEVLEIRKQAAANGWSSKSFYRQK